MNDQLYELTVEKNHLSIIIKALSNYICSQYDGLDAEVVDVPKTMENIKIASDMQLVLKHHLGGVQHAPKQTAETTGLIWIKEVFTSQEPFEPFNDENLQYPVHSFSEQYFPGLFLPECPLQESRLLQN